VHPDQLMAAFAADGAFIWAAGVDACWTQRPHKIKAFAAELTYSLRTVIYPALAPTGPI
jgi:hypothetical protein